MAGPGAVDQIIANRYRLCEMIGTGGMGCVWRAEHVSLRTPVAIKLLRPDVAERDEWRSRFLREAQAAAELRSRHVVHIIDHGIDGGVPYLAMEYLRGESLQARVKKGPLTGEETAIVMRGVLRAISRAHRAGIVHRDLKPDNVFLATDDESSDPWLVKVLDFGIAKLLDERADKADVATSTGVVLGTPFYMSPEQAQGDKTLDARSDLWSLGAIVFECLTGRRLFAAEALGEVLMRICYKPIPIPSEVAKVPPGFDEWFARASQREPKDRFQTAQSFAESLSAVLSPGQRWLDTRSEDAGGSTKTTTDCAMTPVLGDAPTERPEPSAAATNRTASRTITPMDAIRPGGAAKSGWYAMIAVAGVAVAVIGLVSTRRGMSREAAEPATTDVAVPSSPGPHSPSVSMLSPPMVLPTSRPAPSAGASAAVSSSRPVSSSGSPASPSAVPGRARTPPILPPRPAPPPSSRQVPPGAPAPTGSVNLGI